MNPIKTLQKGDTLQTGKYHIEGILGQGGFGITYKAVWHTKVQGPLGEINADIPCAIKELFLSAQSTFCTRSQTDKTVIPNFDTVKFEEFKQKFIDEAHTLSKFQKVKGIVQVLGTFEENATVYFIMEFIAGKSIKGLVENKGALPEKEAIEIIVSILDTLEIVHSKGVLHRDINPNNILLNNENTPVLIDFGIAREYEEDVTQTQTTFRTVGYSAPEQAVLKAKRGAYTDLYSVGGTLYFILTGQRPQSTDEIDLEGFKTPKDYNSKISDNVNNAIIKAIKKRPNERFQSATEFKNALLNADIKAEVPKKEFKDDKTLIDTPQQKKKIVEDDKTLIDKPQQQKQEKKIETTQPKTKVADDFDKEIKNAQKRNRYIYIGISVVALIAILYFVFKNSGTNPKELAEQHQQDSIKKEDSLAKVREKIKQDSITKAKADSIAYANNKELQEKEEKAWKEAKQKNSVESYEKYLSENINGKYRENAKKEIDKIKNQIPIISIAKLDDYYSGNLPINYFSTSSKINSNTGQKVESFELFATIKGYTVRIKSNSEYLTKEQIGLLNKMSNGQKVFFINIKTSISYLPPLIFNLNNNTNNRIISPYDISLNGQKNSIYTYNNLFASKFELIANKRIFIKSFTVLVYNRGFIEEQITQGNTFSTKQIQLIKKIQSMGGKRWFFIFNIEGELENKIVNLPNLFYEIE